MMPDVYVVPRRRQKPECRVRRYMTRFRPISGGANSRMRCDRHVESTVQSIRALRHLTRAFLKIAGASIETIADVETAVGEALTNVNRHAYGGDAGPIDFTLEVEGAEFTCVVRDEGRAATDLKFPTVAPGQLGGLGLYMMGRLMDGVEISHPEGKGRGTLVRMRKRLEAQSQGLFV